MEPKLDGLAIVATYEHGKLVQVATRGDGATGENVTANAANIVGLPLTLTDAPDHVEVRGEAYLDHAGLAAANIERAANAKAPFVNARNAVADMIRSIPTRYQTPLRFSAYDFEIRDQPQDRDRQAMAAAARCGIATAPGLLAETGTVTEIVASVAARRSQLGFDVDGCVINVDRTEARNTLGESSRAPRWAIASSSPQRPNAHA